MPKNPRLPKPETVFDDVSVLMKSNASLTSEVLWLRKSVVQLEEFIGRREDDILSISRDRELLHKERDEKQDELINANKILAQVRKVRDDYASQARFADIDCAVYFRDFCRRLDKACEVKK